MWIQREGSAIAGFPLHPFRSPYRFYISWGNFLETVFDTVYMCFLLLTMLAFVVDFKLVKPGNKQMAVMVLIGAIEFALIINEYHFYSLDRKSVV